jgi:hypothetical protein
VIEVGDAAKLTPSEQPRTHAAQDNVPQTIMNIAIAVVKNEDQRRGTDLAQNRANS